MRAGKIAAPIEWLTDRAAYDQPSRSEHGEAFLADCLHGLAQPRKSLPCKWLYDDAGSALFERICTTPEYYPSRTEMGLLADAAPWLGNALRRNAVLIEFGSGASRKTRLLLDAAPSITGYVPIDISESELARAAGAIAADYRHVAVRPILGDFTQALNPDPEWAGRERIGFFPGSTLGNFPPSEGIAFLSAARELLGTGSRLLLGVDVAKDVETLLAAYDDAGGVTAAFNLNLITRMNRELGCDIDPAAFEHRAVWNGGQSRVEMHLLSRRRQSIDIGDHRFVIDDGETIHTENSHKLEREVIDGMLAQAGWSIERRWTSETPSYDLILLRC